MTRHRGTRRRFAGVVATGFGRAVQDAVQAQDGGIGMIAVLGIEVVNLLERLLVDAVQQFHGDQLADDLAILILGCSKDVSGVSSAGTARRCSAPA